MRSKLGAATRAIGPFFARRIQALRTRARGSASTVIELVGYTLFVIAGARVSPTLGIAVAGALCLVVAFGLEGGRGPRAQP